MPSCRHISSCSIKALNSSIMAAGPGAKKENKIVKMVSWPPWTPTAVAPALAIQAMKAQPGQWQGFFTPSFGVSTWGQFPGGYKLRLIQSYPAVCGESLCFGLVILFSLFLPFPRFLLILAVIRNSSHCLVDSWVCPCVSSFCSTLGSTLAHWALHLYFWLILWHSVYMQA